MPGVFVVVLVVPDPVEYLQSVVIRELVIFQLGGFVLVARVSYDAVLGVARVANPVAMVFDPWGFPEVGAS